jgi:hypothetical protein
MGATKIVGAALSIAALLAVVGLGVRLASRDNPPSTTELRKIDADRVLVERWIGRCLAVSESRPAPADLKLNAGTNLNADAKPIDPSQIHPAYYRIAAVNNALAERRVAYDIQWSDAFIRAELATWASVAIGLLTTIMVALSSTDLVDKAQKKGGWIRFSALTLPAIGTAVAAVVAFYEPSALLANRKAQAAAAEQLHIQIGQGVWKVACFKSADAALSLEQTALFDAWSQRFQELVSRTDAKANAGGSGTTSGGSKS